MAILKALLTLPLKGKCFEPKCKPLKKVPQKTLLGNTNKSVMPGVTGAMSTIITNAGARSLPAPTSSGLNPIKISAVRSEPIKQNNGSSRNKCQTAAPQGAKPKVYRPAARQAVVQLLEVTNEVSEQ